MHVGSADAGHACFEVCERAAEDAFRFHAPCLGQVGADRDERRADIDAEPDRQARWHDDTKLIRQWWVIRADPLEERYHIGGDGLPAELVGHRLERREDLLDTWCDDVGSRRGPSKTCAVQRRSATSRTRFCLRSR
jgi:hypothetical protein